MFRFISALVLFFVTSLNYHSYGSSSDLFFYDEALIELKFAQLSKVEVEISQQKDFDVISVDSLLNKSGINDYAKSVSKKKEFEDIDKLLTFGAGCVLAFTGIVGVSLAYYIIYDDKELGKKALIYSSAGCLVTTLTYAGFIIALSVY